MRRFVLAVTLLAATLAPAAHAAPPAVSVQAAPALGAAPLKTTLTASGDAVAYRWELPGGAVAAGPSVSFTFPAGRHLVSVVGTSASGEETRASVTVTSVALEASAPRVADYRRRVKVRGTIVPALTGARVALLREGIAVGTGRIRPGGHFVMGMYPRSPATYTVAYGGAVSDSLSISLRPRIKLELRGARVVGASLTAVARLEPTAAGPLTLTVRRSGKPWRARTDSGRVVIRLDSRRQTRYALRATVEARAGFVTQVRSLGAAVRLPALGVGSTGPAVYALETQLRKLTYALPAADSFYGWETAQAVLAFQTLHGLPRTGRVDVRLWRALERAAPPRARYGGDHIEVSKSLQVLLLVRNGRVVLTSHVSTGATGNTPVGRWRVYRKVTGWDWVLWYPMYFLRGFAIHGYPDVPAYPASHGCVRIPMWLAPRLFATNGYGTVIYVY
ncbi:MAG: L,D-transpeptidase family protein [Gaiellaceae bacterium]